MRTSDAELLVRFLPASMRCQGTSAHPKSSATMCMMFGGATRAIASSTTASMVQRTIDRRGYGGRRRAAQRTAECRLKARCADRTSCTQNSYRHTRTVSSTSVHGLTTSSTSRRTGRHAHYSPLRACLYNIDDRLIAFLTALLHCCFMSSTPRGGGVLERPVLQLIRT